MNSQVAQSEEQLFPATIPWTVMTKVVERVRKNQIDLILAEQTTYSIGCCLSYARSINAPTEQLQAERRSTYTTQSVISGLAVIIEDNSIPQREGVVSGDGYNDPTPSKLDPATVLLIITALSDILKLFIKR